MPQKKLDKWVASIRWKIAKPCNILVLLQPPIKRYCVHWSLLSSLLMTEVCFLCTCICPVMTDYWCSRSNRMLDFAVTPCLNNRWRLLNFHISWLAERVLCLINVVIMLCRLESCIKCAFTALRRFSFGGVMRWITSCAITETVVWMWP
jgi:hypothetical protein